MVKRLSLIGGPFLALLVGGALNGAGALNSSAAWVAGVTILCAFWWVTEPIPIPATSIIPFALLPLGGVLTHKEVAHAYGDTLILLLMGGFILSTAMESSGAHRRLALGMVKWLGGRGGRRIVFGFMTASALMSMWISNTATVLMLLPVTMAVLEQSEDRGMDAPLLLGIAYAANVGGIGTPIGTPPNVVMMGVFAETTGQSISFPEWMLFGVPVVILMVPSMWLWLTRHLEREGRPLVFPPVGRWTAAEVRVVAVFALTALAWMTRRAPFGGWSALLGVPEAGDSTVALTASLALFVLPDGRGGRLLTWEKASRIPWGLLLLFGGGIALAKAFKVSGLSEVLGAQLADLIHMPVFLLIFLVCLVVTFLTEVTSNTATTALLMPILAASALTADMDPRLLMIPAAAGASCAFMLPVATAPNAIVFGAERFSLKTMALHGLVINFVGAGVISICAFLYLHWVG